MIVYKYPKYNNIWKEIKRTLGFEESWRELFIQDTNIKFLLVYHDLSAKKLGKESNPAV